MSERLKINKCSNTTTCQIISNQSKILDKTHNPLMLQPSLFQAKLAINQPGDEYEQEADRVAEQVMRMQDPIIQRKCANCEEDEEKILQTKESSEKLQVTQYQGVTILLCPRSS